MREEAHKIISRQATQQAYARRRARGAAGAAARGSRCSPTSAVHA